MKKGTAVEWLISKLMKSKDYQRVINDVNHSGTELRDVINEALSMEKEQIIEAHGNKQKLSKGATNYEYTLTGEMYYNEKFKGIKTEI